MHKRVRPGIKFDVPYMKMWDTNIYMKFMRLYIILLKLTQKNTF